MKRTIKKTIHRKSAKKDAFSLTPLLIPLVGIALGFAVGGYYTYKSIRSYSQNSGQVYGIHTTSKCPQGMIFNTQTLSCENK